MKGRLLNFQETMNLKAYTKIFVDINIGFNGCIPIGCHRIGIFEIFCIGRLVTFRNKNADVTINLEMLRMSMGIGDIKIFEYSIDKDISIELDVIHAEIELSLDYKDKEWFQELTDRYNKLLKQEVRK